MTNSIKLSEVDPLKTQIDPNQRFDTRQTAALCGLSPVSLANARSLGVSPIPYERAGKLIRYKYADVITYLDSLPKFTQ